MRVLVCGGRNYNDVEMLCAVLDNQHLTTPISCIISGAARGADTLALVWAKAHGVPYESYAADWQRYGAQAGPIRNQFMLDRGKPDLVVAFPGGRGTADMIRRADRAGVNVCQYTTFKQQESET
ncbi:MAG TPA: DUF2493 domain-containing protein [Xanthobacteraceae bacterium]